MGLTAASVIASVPGLVTWLRTQVCDHPPTLENIAKMTCPWLDVSKVDTTTGTTKLEVKALLRNHDECLNAPVVVVKKEYDPATRQMGFSWSAACDCDADFPCEHALAVMEFLKNIDGTTPSSAATGATAATAATAPPAPDSDSDSEPEAGLPPPAVINWLRKLSIIGGMAAVAPSTAKLSNKFLAYCIEGTQATWLSEIGISFTLRLGTRTKRGFSIAKKAVESGHPQAIRCMTAEDQVICAAIRQRNRNAWLWNPFIPLEGEGWDEILLPALATGRLMFGMEEDPQDYKRLRYTAVTPGPPLSVVPDWALRNDGAATPVLRILGPKTLVVLKTHPLYYMDLESFQLGVLESPLSAAFLLAWDGGPAAAPYMIPGLRKELAALSPEKPLPMPSAEKVVTLTGITPQPVLRLTELHIDDDPIYQIVAMPQFVYPDGPTLPPTNPGEIPQRAWISDGKRFVFHRDTAAEEAALAALPFCGLMSAQDWFHERELNSRNCHAWLLRTSLPSRSAWLGFLDSPHRQALLDAGWRIESDDDLGLVIHDLRDFFPVIESDPDHGIDWFRFDITGHCDGKRVSLIPHIVRAIREDLLEQYKDPAKLPETLLLACDNPADGFIRYPTRRFLDMVEQVRHLFQNRGGDTGALRLDRLAAAAAADLLAIDSSETTRALAALGRGLRDIRGLPPTAVPDVILAELRPYQTEGFRWLQFLAAHGLHGILADDMGLGKTLQTLAHLAAEHAKETRHPSLVVAPTSVVPNWAAEFEKFAPALKILVLHGSDRAGLHDAIAGVQVVITSYPLLVRDFKQLSRHSWHVLVLDEAQYIKNPKALTAQSACKLKAVHRLCLSGTPMENHLGELWSLMRFLMPGYLTDERTFNAGYRKPIERDHSTDVQQALNRRVAPLILRRTKDQVATDLPEKTIITHGIDLTDRQADLYESVRATMDLRVREALAAKGLAQSHIIVLDALLKLRQICCHPKLLQTPAAQRVPDSAKLTYLTDELLPALLEEGRRILLFSQFTSMLALIEEHLELMKIPFLKLTGQTRERAQLVQDFQSGAYPVFLISLKAGGTGLNLTAADTVIHYDPWWNPAAETQATDRAHRIGQIKPVFVHKLVCRGTIEDRILELQRHKAALVEALLAEDTVKLRIDEATLSHLLSPMD